MGAVCSVPGRAALHLKPPKAHCRLPPFTFRPHPRIKKLTPPLTPKNQPPHLQIGMDLPNYRQRYYEARFPDEVAAGKGVDAIAASVCRHYVVGGVDGA